MTTILSQLICTAMIAVISSCTPYQREAWKASEAGIPLSSFLEGERAQSAQKDRPIRPSASTTQSASRPRPASSAVIRQSAYDSYGPASSDLYVKKKIGSGEFILLSNGVLMEIDPLERIDAMLWMSLDEVKVIRSDRGSIGYDYLIINLSERTQAHSKIAR